MVYFVCLAMSEAVLVRVKAASFVAYLYDDVLAPKYICITGILMFVV